MLTPQERQRWLSWDQAVGGETWNPRPVGTRHPARETPQLPLPNARPRPFVLPLS